MSNSEHEMLMVFGIFALVIILGVIVIFAPLMVMDRNSIIEMAENKKRNFYVDRNKIKEYSESLGIDINLKLNDNFKLGYIMYNKRYNKIEKNYKVDREIMNLLSYVSSLYSYNESNFKDIDNIKDKINNLANTSTKTLTLRLRRKLESDLSKIESFDDISEINRDNISTIYIGLKTQNRKLSKIKKDYSFYVEYVRKIDGVINKLESYYSKIRDLDVINKDYLYRRLLLLIKEIKGYYFVDKINKKSFRNSLSILSLKYDDYVNVYNINKQVNFFYKSKKKIFTNFNAKVNMINIKLLNFIGYEDVIRNNTSFKVSDLKNNFGYFRSNMLKLIKNSYKSLKDLDFKHADISRMRCAYMIKDLNDRVKKLQDLEETVLKARSRYMDYNHELKGIKGSLFSKLQIEFKKEKFNKPLIMRFKKLWDDIIFHEEDKTDIITLSERSMELYKRLLSLDISIRKYKDLENQSLRA